jgi:hypothetical protein
VVVGSRPYFLLPSKSIELWVADVLCESTTIDSSVAPIIARRNKTKEKNAAIRYTTNTKATAIYIMSCLGPRRRRWQRPTYIGGVGFGPQTHRVSNSDPYSDAEYLSFGVELGLRVVSHRPRFHKSRLL